MRFANWLGEILQKLGDLISTGFNFLLDALAFIFAPILLLIEGIFYFIVKLFDVVVMVVKCFVAFFQMFFVMGNSLVSNVIRMKDWNATTQYTDFPNTTLLGFNEVMKVSSLLGYLNIVPLIASAVFIWFFFLHIISMLGDPSTRPNGNGGYIKF